MINTNCILFCRCNAGVISSEKIEELVECFQQLDADVFELRDLCALSIHEKEILQTIGDKYNRKIIVACYPRAIKNMLRQADIEIGEFEVLNFKELSTKQIQDKLTCDFQYEAGSANWQVAISKLDVPAWYPVIDESLCTLCGQCARFCLFGVYRYDKKSLKVVNPLSCKNNCPACGRTCPTSAIMFPRLNENTVLAGAEPAKNNKPVGSNKKTSLFVMLNERNKSRKSIFKQDIVQLAVDERRKALVEFKKNGSKEK